LKKIYTKFDQKISKFIGNLATAAKFFITCKLFFTIKKR